MFGQSKKAESRDIKWVAILFKAGNFISPRIAYIKLWNSLFSSVVYDQWISHSFAWELLFRMRIKKCIRSFTVLLVLLGDSKENKIEDVSQ